MPAVSDDSLARLIEDDVYCGDLTTASLGIGNKPGGFQFRARRSMRLCGVEEAARMCLLNRIDPQVDARSGASLAPGDLILTGYGTAAALHRVWKAAQVFIEWASGIATSASEIVAAADGTPVACTRKNVPGTKAMSVKAVRAGGATMHRLGLSETLLLFPEHQQFLDEPPALTVARLKAQEPEKKIVVEVSEIDSALAWAEAGADVLQLEKFPPKAVMACRSALTGKNLHPRIAAAGGICAGNAAAYVAAGADLLVTSAPFGAPPRDVAVSFFVR